MISHQLLGTLEALLEPTFILAMAWFLALVLRRSSAQLRYLIWSAALVGVLLLPILTLLLPSGQRVEFSVPISGPANPPSSPSAIGTSQMPEVNPAPNSGYIESLSPPTISYQPTMSWSWEEYLTGFWVLGVLLLLAKIGCSWWNLARLARKAHRLHSAEWQNLLDELRKQLTISRTVQLRQSPEVTTPMTGGWLRPVIFLPLGAENWPVARRRVVLMHELLHVKHSDGLVNLLAQLSSAFYWFHPLVWIACHCQKATREEACDEAIVAQGVKPSDYATHLMEISDILATKRRSPAVAMTMIHRSQLEERMMSILKKTGSRRHRPVLTFSVTFGLTGLVLLFAMIQLVGKPLAIPSTASTPGGTVEQKEFSHWFDAPYSFSGTFTTDNRIGFLDGDFVIDRRFDDGFHLSYRLHGIVQFDEDLTTILHLDPDAYLVLATEFGEAEQFLKVTSGENGRPNYDWTIDGQKREFDASSRQWLQTALSVVANYREISEIRGKEGILRGQIGTIRGEEGALHGQIGAIRGEEGVLRGKIGTIHGEAGILRGRIGTIRGQEGVLRGKIGVLRGELDYLQRQQADLKRSFDTSHPDVLRINQHIADLEEKIRETEKEIGELDVESRVKAIEDEIRLLEVKASEKAIEEDIRALKVKERIAEIERKIEDLNVEDRIADIEDQIAELRADERIESIEAQLSPKLKELRRLVGQLAE